LAIEPIGAFAKNDNTVFRQPPSIDRYKSTKVSLNLSLLFDAPTASEDSFTFEPASADACNESPLDDFSFDGTNKLTKSSIKM